MPRLPLTPDELAAALEAIGGFEARPQVAVAVSGGPDSMALMLLADRWARQRGGQAFGLTVDHGLRPESAAEAQTVGTWLAARGIPHETLVWAGGKPQTGTQEAAREARYALLAGWCRAHGVLHVLTAHHREDQIETYLIRRRAGSGPDGLAGMSAVRESAGCRIVRPLLSMRQARLTAFLDAEGQPFLLDPSNLDPAFERARLRRDGRSDAGCSQLPGAIGELEVYARQRMSREQALAAALARIVDLHPAGFAALDAAALGALDAEFGERLLGRVALCVGVSRYPSRRERVSNLRKGLLAFPDGARTLGGCAFVPWQGRILVLRELVAAEPPVQLEPGVAFVWDRRFIVHVPSTAAPLMFGYLGQSGHRRPDDLPKVRTGDLPRLVYPVLPALWDNEGLAAVPSLGCRRIGAGALPCISFRPAHPLAQPAFTVV